MINFGLTGKDAIDGYCQFFAGICSSSGAIRISNYTPSSTIKYVAIGTGGVKHGSISVSLNQTVNISGIGEANSPFIAMFAI